jgi:hypothetical protein
LGSGINSYSFKTPQDAVFSQLDIEINRDIRALIEMEALISNPKAKEKRTSLKFHQESEYQGKKILFISYKLNGFTKYDTQAVEKDAETGYWLPSYVSSYDMNDDEPLKKTIQEWKNKTETEIK